VPLLTPYAKVTLRLPMAILKISPDAIVFEISNGV
jgi:hypothetical protein